MIWLRPLPSAASVDPELYRSFVMLHLVTPLFGLPIGGAFLALGLGAGSVTLSLAAATCFFWLIPFLARADLERAAFISVQVLTGVSLLGAFAYGGLNSPFAVWLVVAVLLGFLYLQNGIASCIALMAVQGALFIAAHHHWFLTPQHDQAELGVLFLVSSFTAAVYVSLIASFYSRIKIEGSKLAQISQRYDETANSTVSIARQLEEDDRNISEFMARTSHELRTALDVVIGYSELLLEEAASDERETDERRLSQITTSSRQLLGMISDGDRLAETARDEAAAPRFPEQTFAAEEAQMMPSRHFTRLRRPAPSKYLLPLALFGLSAFLVTLLLPSAIAGGMHAIVLTILVGAVFRLKGSNRRPSQIDLLTGLPNRAAFWQELERRAGPSSRSTALLFADLNGFKEVNDSLGHDAGDQLLAEVGKRFSSVRPSGILLARLGGDEFGAVAFGQNAETTIRRFAEDMLHALVQPVQTDEFHLTIGVSIGLAHGHDGQVSGKELLRRSDVAMYRAKHDKRTPIRTFDAEMDEALNFRRTMRHDLAGALSADKLDLHLQPVVDTRTGELASAEALLRWTHPVLGPISPAKLITLAEESGQIIAIDDWVLERALEYTKRLGVVPIAVNISPVQFRHPHFARKVVDRLDAHNVPPQLIRLEITEGVLVSHTRAAERAISELREAGVKIALDDFGTGYSSLSYLRDFGFDFLKVDRSFVTALEKGRQGAELLRAIVDLGHSLSMNVIAEGVETSEQAAAVQLLGCDFIQGYFTGRPMSVDHLEAWLSQRSGMSAIQGLVASGSF
jgi:diguanylate cyclase (GGDEF)-like protein